MKNQLFTLLILISPFLGWAQKTNAVSLNLSHGLTLSTFIFTNSQNEHAKDIDYSLGNSFTAGLNFHLKSRHLIETSFSLFQAGAKSISNQTDIKWNLNYLGFGVGYGYKLVNKPSYTFTPGISFSENFMLKGEQYINFKRYDLISLNALKQWNLQTAIFLQNQFRLNEKVSLNINYQFGVGLIQIEKNDAPQQQKTRTIGHQLTYGITINL